VLETALSLKGDDCLQIKNGYLFVFDVFGDRFGHSVKTGDNGLVSVKIPHRRRQLSCHAYGNALGMSLALDNGSLAVHLQYQINATITGAWSGRDGVAHEREQFPQLRFESSPG
jgi:hypothetical protein